MLRMSLSVRRLSPRALGSALSLTLALAGTAALPAPAAAQAQAPQAPAQPQVKPSRNFAKVYQPVADIANATGADYAGAKAQLPGVVNAVENADDRYLAGTLSYVLGLKLNDRALQQQGMSLMLDSGKAAPDAAREMHYYLGEWAYDAQNWASARTHLQAARAAGYTQGNAEGLIAESYFKEGQTQQGLAYLEGLIQQRQAARQPVPDAWIRRALKVAYDAQDTADVGKWSAMLVAANPTPENWGQVLQLVEIMDNPDAKVRLDLMRLRALTNSLSDRRAYETYIEAADPRIMANEVSRVLSAGRTAGIFSEGDSYYGQIKTIVDARVSGEAAEAARYASGAAGAANGRPAQNAGELFLALQDYAKAEQMLQLALTKGGIDRDEVLTRLGIAQVQQNKLAEAKATFAQVGGARTSVARMWSAYAQSRG